MIGIASKIGSTVGCTTRLILRKYRSRLQIQPTFVGLNARFIVFNIEPQITHWLVHLVIAAQPFFGNQGLCFLVLFGL